MSAGNPEFYAGTRLDPASQAWMDRLRCSGSVRDQAPSPACMTCWCAWPAARLPAGADRRALAAWNLTISPAGPPLTRSGRSSRSCGGSGGEPVHDLGVQVPDISGGGAHPPGRQGDGG